MARLFIFLKQDGTTYETGDLNPKVTITVKKEPYPGNFLFERVSHKIGRNTNVMAGCTYIIYDGTIYNEGTKLFEYFNAICLLDRVDGYYSIQDPANILLLGFKYQIWFHGGKTCYYTYNRYLRVTSIPFDLISKASFSLPKGQGPGEEVRSHQQVTKNLTEENKKVNIMFTNKKIRLSNTGIEKNVSEIKRYVGDFSFISLIPEINAIESSPGEYILSMDQLFKADINEVDYNYKGKFKLNNRKFDLINVYYCNFHRPLVVELVNDGNKTYFRRKNAGEKNQWDKLRRPEISHDTNEALCKILKIILLGLNYNLTFSIEKQSQYCPLIKGTSTDCSSPPIQSKIEATVNDYNISTGYKYYTHSIITSLSNSYGTASKHIIMELVISLYDKNISVCKEDGSKATIVYKDNSNQLSVYFYLKSTSSSNSTDGNSSDTVPLMLHFNGKWYQPQNKANYFKEWTEVGDLKGIPGPHYSSYYYKVKEQLDKANRMLNRIELQRASDYGIPTIIGTEKSNLILRVNVTNDECNDAKNRSFVRYTHLTFNKSPIGDIYLNDKEKKVDIQKADYDSKGFNRVIAFFLLLDNQHLYPLLICLGKEDTYTLYYELEGIIDSTYKYRKAEPLKDFNCNDMEKRLTDTIKKLDSETQKMIIMVYGDRSQSLAKFTHNLEEQSLNLMRTIIPVGGVYLVAGASIYPASAFIHSFLALI